MTTSHPVLDWAERRMPALARAVATPSVRGAAQEPVPSGIRWTGSSVRARVLYFTPSPATSQWLAGSLAVRLRAAITVPERLDAPVEVLRELQSESTLPVAVVGEADGCLAAITAARAGGHRLALLSPPPIKRIEASGWPTTLVQASATREHRAADVALVTTLRRAGVAVRETEYDDVEDGWARYPRVSRGSRRGLDDLVAFLDRGIGEASTFDVIPGWDLH